MNLAYFKTKQQLAAYAAEAQAVGRGTAVLMWWCDVASTILGLAVRARGHQLNIGQQWFAAMPPGSTCSSFSRAYNAACVIPLTDVTRTELSQLCDSPPSAIR